MVVSQHSWLIKGSSYMRRERELEGRHQKAWKAVEKAEGIVSGLGKGG